MIHEIPLVLCMGLATGQMLGVVIVYGQLLPTLPT